jgi:hypothetical protein
VTESDGAQWGFFRRPALLGPAVGFLAFLGSEAVQSPASGNPDGLVWLPLFLIVASLVAAIPYLVGAFLLIVVFRIMPRPVVSFIGARVFIGAAIGASIALPFGYALNSIPSANSDPRFNMVSMLVGCSVAGAFCAAFFAQPRLGAPPDQLLERTRDR